jgi:hypothetical protein
MSHTVVMPSLSLADKAEDILRRHSKGAPMHYRQLTEIGVSEGAIIPGGPTPEASLNSAVTQDIKKRGRSGEAQRFRSHGRGLFSLHRGSDPLRGAVETKNRDVRDRLRAVLGETHPRAFEELIGELLVAIGFEDVEVTKYVGDKGIDLRARLVVGGVTNVRTAIQVKRYTSGSIGAPVVRELRGGLGPHERGLIITLSSFSRDAQREASEPDRSPISLVDGEQLLDLLIVNEIGVTSTNVTILELDEGFFSEGVEEDAPGAGAETEASVQSRRFQRTRVDQVLSLWPLPGGGAAWKTTLDEMVRFVAAEGPTMDRAIDWLIASFDRVASTKTARGYWQVLRSFGLTETDGERLTLTSSGAEYLSEPTGDALLAIARRRIVGVSEMIEWLSSGSKSADDLLQLARQELDVTWDSLAQVQFRLGWLSVLGVVASAGGRWGLAPEAQTPDDLPQR